MSQKRDPDECSSEKNLEGNQSPDDKRRRILRSFRSVVLEVITQIRFRRIQQALEPMLRKVLETHAIDSRGNYTRGILKKNQRSNPVTLRVLGTFQDVSGALGHSVKEEVESAVRKHGICFTQHCEDNVFPSEPRSLRLKFLSTISLPVFTGTRIEGEDGSAIKVALVDAFTGEVVQYAPESSAKVEVLVLEGDFDGDNEESWTLEEFKNNIVKQREGKKPLLTGDVYFCLKEGVGSVGEVYFTDNSSWTRSRRFKLGARVVGNCDGGRIKEAKTESFIVRDHRGELYKKHHPPSLSDEVWRLEKIGKDGAFHKRLSKAAVNTVKDFLTLLHVDPAQLRSILGSGMSAKMWEVTVEHARTCVVGERVHLYYSPTSQHNNGVVFNVVGQVKGLYSESHYVPIDKMSENDKIDAQAMVIEGFACWDGVTSFDDLNSLVGISPHTASSSGTVTPDERTASASKKVYSLDYAEPPSIPMPSPDILPSMDSLGCMSSSPGDFSLQGIDTLNVRYDQPLDSLLCEPDYLMQTFCDNEHLKFLDIDYSSFQSENPSSESQLPSSSQEIRRPAYRRWRVLSSVVRWLMRRTGSQKR